MKAINNNKAIVVIMLITMGLIGCNGSKTAQDYIEDGQSSIQTQNYSKAVIELKNAVRLAPKDANARALLGKAYLAQGNYLNAEKELSKAQDLGDATPDTIIGLSEAWAKKGDIERLYQLAEQANSLDDKDYAQVLYYAGIAAFSNQEKSTSESYLEQVIGLAKNDTVASLAQAYLDYIHNEFEKSLNTINELVVTSPNNREALLLKGHLLFALENYQQANLAYRDYLKLTPQDSSTIFYIANGLLKAEQYDEAEIEVDKLLTRYKNSPLANQYKAQIEYQKGNFREAVNFADNALNNGLNNNIARMIAGVSAYNLADTEQAYGYLKPLEKYLPATHPVQKMLAVIKLKLGYTDEALESFSALEGLSGADVDLLQASSIELMRTNDFEAAETLIDKAQKLDPTNARLAAQKGMLLLSQNDISGIESLERALSLDPSLEEVELALAMQYLKLGEDLKAQDIANKWLSNNTESASGYLLQGVIYTKQEKLVAAKASFDKVLTIDEKSIAALYNLAILAEKEQQHDVAKKYYQDVIMLAPGHQGALQRLTRIDAENNNLKETIDFLQRTLLDKKNNINLTLSLAQNYGLNNELEKAITILEQVDKSQDLPPKYWVFLGDSYLKSKKIEQARSTYQQALEKFPKDFTLQMRYIGMLEIERKYIQALDATRSAYKIFPNNTRVEMLLAHFELANKNKDGAKSYIEILKRKKITHPFLNDLIGNLALVNKDYSQAEEYFSLAFQASKSAKNAVNLARALKFNSKQAEAEKTLESYLDKNKTNDKVRLLLAELYGANDRDKKIVQYQEVVERAPDNIVVLNNLAWNYYKLGKPDEAIKFIEKAYELKPDVVALQETYGTILVALKRYEQGYKVLMRAKKSGSTDTEALDALQKAERLKSN